MILEAMFEEKLIQALSAMPELSATQIVGSRLENKVEKDESDKTIIAIATGFRQHDNFSLSPITLPVAITIVTRVEDDKCSQRHNDVVEALADKLSYWHKYGDDMTSTLSTTKCNVHELKIDGGSSQVYDRTNSTWNDTINITLRGAEVFAI